MPSSQASKPKATTEATNDDLEAISQPGADFRHQLSPVIRALEWAAIASRRTLYLLIKVPGLRLVSQSLDRAENGISSSSSIGPNHVSSSDPIGMQAETGGKERFWARLKGRGRKKVGWGHSAKAIALSSWLNILLIFVPFAFAARFHRAWGHGAAFAFAFLSIIPLEKLFDWGGEQLALYCGVDIGDLIVITLNNAVEATLAIILLLKCELKLLQSTIAGVVLLHLLLVPGTAFLIGGARIWEQKLQPTRTQLNHTLLTLGVLALVIPAAFFAALDPGVSINAGGESTGGIIDDTLRGDFLRFSRGFAIILLFVYLCSRFYLHDPPGEDNAIRPPSNAPKEAIEREMELANAEPEVNPWACIILLTVTVAIMAVMAEFLVESIEFVREQGNIQEEVPGAHEGGLAHSLNADLYEVTTLIGSCFLVNYITADAKTNWVEGIIMISFYLMIGLSAWYYTGQPEISIMAACENIQEALASGVGAG
ncbi:hypothetical protein EW146_g7031 [Bondarzewia mesenterica]|uniref:Sodium/calcium exchanger membrane region domain-containing protein n=1 Tax=Bondarzewia mesenterica TaxID=1095465 RepID=A0A4S4LSM4_9AGAM|nr:hypothetical protein EW146_g7031 [Bondarzewia mesenterica]